MSESISKNNELENEMTLDMSYFWYSDVSNDLPRPCLRARCIEIPCDFLLSYGPRIAWPRHGLQYSTVEF